MKTVSVQGKWKIIYFTYRDPIRTIINAIQRVSNSSANWVEDVYDEINYGFTYSIPSKRTSIVFISEAENKYEFFETFVHELKHVQSHICEYYDVSESGEEAAYLIGYLTKIIMR